VFVADGEHSIAKDAANSMWIGQLQVGQRIFFLDSWVASGTAGSARFHAVAPEREGVSGADAFLEEVGSASPERLMILAFACSYVS